MHLFPELHKDQMFINKLHYYLQLKFRTLKTKPTHTCDMGIEVFQRRKRRSVVIAAANCI